MSQVHLQEEQGFNGDLESGGVDASRPSRNRWNLAHLNLPPLSLATTLFPIICFVCMILMLVLNLYNPINGGDDNRVPNSLFLQHWTPSDSNLKIIILAVYLILWLLTFTVSGFQPLMIRILIAIQLARISVSVLLSDMLSAVTIWIRVVMQGWEFAIRWTDKICTFVMGWKDKICTSIVGGVERARRSQRCSSSNSYEISTRTDCSYRYEEVRRGTGYKYGEGSINGGLV